MVGTPWTNRAQRQGHHKGWLRLFLQSCALLSLTFSLAQALEVRVNAADWESVLSGAANGTTIVFPPGDYSGQCNLVILVDLNLVGEGGREVTEIHCGDSARHFHISGSARVSINGLSLSGGSTTMSGGCIWVEQASQLSVTAAKFSNCSAAVDGGAIYVNASKLSAVDVLFEANDAEVFGGSVALLHSEAHVASSTFRHNTALFNGGGLHVSSSSVQMHDTTMTENHAGRGRGISFIEGHGGAVAVIGAGGSLTATGSEFSHNFAESYGGAINLIAGAVAHLSDGCTVHKNQANHQGGAVSMRDGTALTLARGVVMSENFAAVAYRVFLPTNGGGAIYARAGADIVMEGKVSFVGNFAGSLGGAVCGFRGATITVAEGAEVEIRENEAMMIGAGLLCWEACDFSNSGQMDIVANKNLEVARAQWGGAGMAFSGVSGGQVRVSCRCRTRESDAEPRAACRVRACSGLCFVAPRVRQCPARRLLSCR